MNYQSTNISNLLLNMSDEASEIFAVAYETSKNLKTLESALVTEKEYLEANKGVDVDEFDFLQLSLIEDYLNFPEPLLLRKFSDGRCGASTAINRRCRDFVDKEEIIRTLADSYITNYIPLSTEEVSQLRGYVQSALSHLSTFLFFMYNVDDTCCEAMIDSHNYTINIDIHRYADKNLLNELSIATELFNLRFDYKPNINVLEQYPELEEPFYDVAGSSVEDFEALEDKLTYEDVIRVINSNPNNIDSIISEIEHR